MEEKFLSFIKEFYGLIITFIGSGAAGGYFLKSFEYKRDKKKRQAHLKAKLLDEILDQCRRIEKKLSNYENTLTMYKRYLDDEEVDAETGYPKNIFDFDIKESYIKYINSLKEIKEVLRHKHQNYIIKSKSEEINSLNVIDKSLTAIINYDDSPEFDYEAAKMRCLEVYTDLRMIHHQIKDVYPEEVSLD